MSRKKPPLLVANWKMHKTQSECRAFLEKLLPSAASFRGRICIAPPLTSLHVAIETTAHSSICVGSQNVHQLLSGPFTGEVSAPMLKEAGAEFVIIGHSERRLLFSEKSTSINQKIRALLNEGLLPLLCIGESLLEHKQKQTEAVLAEQLNEALKDIPPCEMLIAYEPVWAIGTGVSVSSEIVGLSLEFCKKHMKEKWGEAGAEKLSFLYGGSVNPENAKMLIDAQSVDGLLVGGASLDIEKFNQIIDELRK